MAKLRVDQCPKCRDDNVEKVGWNYWYCNGCSNIWELMGNIPLSVNPGKSKRPEAGSKLTGTPTVPRPGSLKTSTGIDFPDV